MRIILLCIGWLMMGSIQAQSYDIEVRLQNYADSTIMLGYHFGNSQYIQDTIPLNDDGFFHIQGSEPLIPGIYLLILKPDNAYVEFLVEEDQAPMKITLDAQDRVHSFKATGSKSNEEFYDYLRYLDVYQSKIGNLRSSIDSTDTDAMMKTETEIASIKAEVKKGQAKWLTGNPDGFVSAIIRANEPLQIPEFTGTEEEQNVMRWKYYRDHYFDNMSLTDVRLLRTPILLTRVDYYLEKLTVQHPDSLIASGDMILNQMSGNSQVFKFGVSHLLNKYAASKVVGMDAIYVHLIQKYYEKGLTPWVSEENIAKMSKQAAKLKPLLIGKTAPDIKVYKEDRSEISLHEIASPFTVLLFWAPDCSHCKKSMPALVDFYSKYKEKGVEIMAVCTKTRDKEPACWDMVKDKNMGLWINASDKDLKSRFQLTYDIKSTPQIYILDADKKIVMKRIGTEQLAPVMDQLLLRLSSTK